MDKLRRQQDEPVEPIRSRLSPRAPGPFRTAALALTLLLPACSAELPSRSTRADHDTITIGTSVGITGVNQLTGAHSRFGQDIIDLLFLSLFEEQPDFADRPPSFEPEIAKRYSWSSDNLSLRVQLRDDIVWSDRTPLTAEDVVWSLAAQADPQIAWAYASSKESIADIEILGPYEIVVTYFEERPNRLADLNVGVILPKHAWGQLPFSDWRQRGDWFLENLVVSGPYTLADWRPQEEIVLERNPYYYRDNRPRIDRLRFRIIPEYGNRLRQLLHGRIDFMEQLRVQDLPVVRSSLQASAASYWHRQYTYIAWNACRTMFSDPIVRRALTLAIDREAIIEALFGDHARVGVSPIPQSVWAFDPSLEPLPYDPLRARTLLETAGWRDLDGDGLLEKAGTSFSFELSTNADNTVRQDAALMIQSQLRLIGVDTRISSLEFNTLIDRNMAGEFDATIGAWGIDTTLDMAYAFHSRSIGNGYNYGCYADSEADRLLDDAAREVDPLIRRHTLHEIQRRIHHDQPYTFLWEPRRFDGVSRRLLGVKPNPLSAFFGLEDWALPPDAR